MKKLMSLTLFLSLGFLTLAFVQESYAAPMGPYNEVSEAKFLYQNAFSIGIRDNLDTALLSDEHCDSIRARANVQIGSVTATNEPLPGAESEENYAEIQKGLLDGKDQAKAYNEECVKILTPRLIVHYGPHFSYDNPTDQIPE